MLDREQIVQEALSLPPEDRTYVADALEQSLADGEFATPEIAAEWTAEIDRRIAAYDRGEVQAIDGKIALERLRARLEEHRRRRVTQ